ncbi:MAG TPA: thiol reductant ABC exporter subunit CydD [Anaerolineales bacterium]
MKVTPRLLSLAGDSRHALAATVLSGLLTGLLTIGQAAGLSRVVDGVFLGGQLLSDETGLLRLLLFIVFLRALLAWGSEVSATAVAISVKSDLRQRLFDKILSLGPAYTRGERTGELVNAAVEGMEALDAYFSQYLPQLFIAVLVPLSILMVVFPRDPLSGLVLLLTAPLIPIFMYLIGKTAETLTKRQWDTLSLLSAYFLDSLQGLTTLKELGRSREHANSIAEASNRFRDVTLSVLRVTFLSALVLELVATVSTAVVAVEVGLRLLYGQLAFQQALFLLLLAPEFYIPLRMLGLRFHAGMSGATAARRIFEILDAPVSGDQGSGIRDQDSHPLSLSPASLIAFENLSYVYPSEAAPALRDITLEIHAGEHIALVGLSGAGKSTLAALLLRFIHPDCGQITINHEPLAEIPLESWRRLIAWVPQNPYLFHDTLAANLRLARPDATDEQLAAAARAAHLDEFVQSLPQGYGTVVGEEGARLSGGQAQRLALARAFLKNAPILILDEPTSSLDPEQEMLVESAIHDLMHGRTVITIAHRLNTVFQADRIFVLEQGRLAEEGTHRELLAQGGIYYRLVGATGQTVDLTPKSQGHAENYEFVSSDLRGSVVDEQPIVHRPSSILRLLGFLNGSWGWVAFSVLLSALTVGSNVCLMGTSAFLISAAALHPELGALQVAIVSVRFFGIARGVFRYAERLTSHNVTFRLLARLRTWFYRALEPLAPARLMEHRAGDLLARIVADVETLENFYIRVIAPPLVATVVTAGMVIFFARYDLPLAWVYLAFMLVLGIGVPLLSWTLSRRAGTELVSRRAALQSRLVDGIQGLAELLIFGRGTDFSESLVADGKAYSQTQRYLGSLTGFSNALTILLVNLGMLAVLALAIPLVVAGQITGVMLAVLTLSALAGFEAVMPLPLAAQTLSSSLQAARRLFEVVDAEPMVRESLSVRRDSSSESLTTSHELRITNLTFSYPGRSQPALQDITFQLTPGKWIAIVGPSGAGKSTLANLLLRFWDYSQGRILLDGHDLHEFAQEDVRRLVSVISQRTYFFNDTIRQNLLLARPTATESEVQNAAQRAQIHEFIVGLPKGYETIIGERGFRLSGGERQRLAIARAFLKNAPIFLLDEPTANLDPLTERHLLDMLFTLTRDQSLLLITHRLVGLEHVDEILVLDHGRIIERGAHADLLALGGLYRRLWDLQNRILSDRTGA